MGKEELPSLQTAVSLTQIYVAPTVFRCLIKVTRQARTGPATPCPCPSSKWLGGLYTSFLDGDPVPTYQGPRQAPLSALQG